MTTKREVTFPTTPLWIGETKYNVPKVWDIYLAYIPPMEEHGHQTYGIRPFLITSNNKNNKYSTEVNGMPITTKSARLPIHVTIEPTLENGLTKTSTIIVEQIKTIPKRFLIQKLGTIEDEELRMKIRKAFMMQSGMFNI